MPIFKVGNFNDIGIMSPPTARVLHVEHKATVSFPKTLSTDALSEKSFNIELPSLNLLKSPKKWGLFLKSLTLKKSFEGFIANLFNPDNEIYFTSIGWDYSGTPPFVYPPKGSKASDFLIPMKTGNTRKFIGDGITLFPVRTVVGSLNISIIVYECDKDFRKLGETLAEFHDDIDDSYFSSLITAISNDPRLAIGDAILSIGKELTKVIGKIMKRNSDDYVDLFEGSYATHKQHKIGPVPEVHESCEIELEFTEI